MDNVHKLDILVPQYNEDDSIVKPLLDSIAIQQGIDFNDIRVIICNDGSDIKLSDDFIGSYPYTVLYHLLPHKGVSATRNACLDLSTSEYIMFCDADDMFLSALGIWLIFDEIRKGEFDDLTSEFIAEELDDSGKPIFNIYDRDGIFVHGKVFRRQYIVDSGIRFNEKLSICEDCNFVALAQSLTKNHRYVSIPFYLWKWRNGSVSRSDSSFKIKMNMQMLESNQDLLDKLMDRNLMDTASMYAVQMILNFYYSSTVLDSSKKTSSYEYKILFDGYLNWYRKYGFLWEGVSVNDKAFAIEKLFSDYIFSDPVRDAININKWVSVTLNQNK